MVERGDGDVRLGRSQPRRRVEERHGVHPSRDGEDDTWVTLQRARDRRFDPAGTRGGMSHAEI
jgi:hypothetical protein